jgi:hypothetical protein
MRGAVARTAAPFGWRLQRAFRRECDVSSGHCFNVNTRSLCACFMECCVARRRFQNVGITIVSATLSEPLWSRRRRARNDRSPTLFSFKIISVHIHVRSSHKTQVVLPAPPLKSDVMVEAEVALRPRTSCCRSAQLQPRRSSSSVRAKEMKRTHCTHVCKLGRARYRVLAAH